ncbi:MAG: signal recognition particle protein [Pseudomonadota bacterium]
MALKFKLPVASMEDVFVLEILTRGFRDARDYLKGIRTLNEDNIAEALKLVRVSLLEADVEFQIARTFIERVKEKALGEMVLTRVKYKEKQLAISPGDHFTKLCNDELVRLMGQADPSLSLSTKPVSTIMMVGLQGSGKTTTAAKLARYLVKQGKRPMLVAADIYRPAAIDQLRKLGESLEIPVYSDAGATPPVICRKALQAANEENCDVALFDTAGRHAVDENLMEELRQIEDQTHPDNVLLVCDAMIGQESVHIARAFNERIRLTGFILTKLDGDARGGAALSIKEATGVPIKFVGMGESLDRLEEFRPDGLASRILGFGDVVGLVQDFQEVVDEKAAEEDAVRMLQGQYNLSDFLGQIRTIKRMGPLQDVMEKLPFFSSLPQGMQVDEYELVRIESMINSMTPAERKTPSIINDGRIKRIAAGSGRQEPEVHDLLVKFKNMRDLLAVMGGGKARGRWKKLKGFTKMFGDGIAALTGGAGPNSEQYNPYGMPEVAGSKGLSKKELEKRRKKGKEAKKARKKGRK